MKQEDRADTLAREQEIDRREKELEVREQRVSAKEKSLLTMQKEKIYDKINIPVWVLDVVIFGAIAALAVVIFLGIRKA